MCVVFMILEQLCIARLYLRYDSPSHLEIQFALTVTDTTLLREQFGQPDAPILM